MHASEAVELAVSDDGVSRYRVRLVSADDGSGCYVRWERLATVASECLTLQTASMLLDALDDGGDVAFQTVGALLAQARK